MANNFTMRRNPKFRSATTKKGQNGVAKARGVKTRVQDARQKIITKKRRTMVDARDVLAKMAKTQDARGKIEKMRATRGVTIKNGNRLKTIGDHIVQKTDRNGKISLTTNKTKAAPSEMNTVIKRQLGLTTSPQKAQVKRLNTVRRAAAAPIQTQARQVNARAAQVQNQSILRKQIVQPYVYETVNPSAYRWSNPAASSLIGALGGRRRMDEDMFETVTLNRPIRLGRQPVQQRFIDLDAMEEEEEIDSLPPMQMRGGIALQGTSRISNIHSRLDTMPESHGILSQIKTKVVVPAGHRIVVSNLQNTVSLEDIKELFEDIGELLAARLVRSGVAEVIYKNLKDAQKAVDTYHNRQLDGQPMKCLLVNKRPLSSANNTGGTLVSDNNTSILRKTVPLKPASNKLVPDISTIHKVLFQRKN